MNAHNLHTLEDEKPHPTCTYASQRKFTVQVWDDNVGNCSFGLYILPQTWWLHLSWILARSSAIQFELLCSYVYSSTHSISAIQSSLAFKPTSQNTSADNISWALYWSRLTNRMATTITRPVSNSFFSSDFLKYLFVKRLSFRQMLSRENCCGSRIWSRYTWYLWKDTLFNAASMSNVSWCTWDNIWACFVVVVHL